MNQLRTNKVAASVIAAIMIALLLTTAVVFTRNSQLKEEAEEEKLHSEKLLSEKLLLTKQIEEFRGELASLKGKNKEIDVLLEKANSNLNKQEATIKSLSKEASDAKILRKQLTDIKQLRENLLSELQQVMASKEKLNEANIGLQNKNNELTKDIDNLLAENKLLAQQLKDKSFTGSNFKIEVIKGKKDKLTVKAKRTDKIRIEFEVAANTYPVDPTFIHVDLLSPEKTLPAGEIEVKVENQAQFSASMDSSLPGGDSQKVIIEYTPKDNLMQGVYTVLVFQKNNFLGKSQFRLMK